MTLVCKSKYKIGKVSFSRPSGLEDSILLKDHDNKYEF